MESLQTSQLFQKDKKIQLKWIKSDHQSGSGREQVRVDAARQGRLIEGFTFMVSGEGLL